MINHKNWSIFFGLSCLFILLDQSTKFLSRKYFTLPLEISSFFSLAYRTNSGALWGMMQGYNWLFVLLSLLAVGGIVYFFSKEELNLWPQIFLALILAGAIGNLVDRVIFGKVTDFIEFSFWPTFNLADSFITIGVLSMAIYLILIKKEEK